MDMFTKVSELIDLAQSRRSWMRGGLAMVGGVALANSTGLGRAFAQDAGILEILNFALTLEHLENTMYRQILATNVLDGKAQMYFQEFGQHESAHVDALTTLVQQLGGTPVQEQENYSFPPFDTRANILDFVAMVEDIGIGAYQGAAPAIENKEYLATAGSIMQVEARHTAAVRRLQEDLPPAQVVPSAFTNALTMQEVLDKVQPILSTS